MRDTLLIPFKGLLFVAGVDGSDSFLYFANADCLVAVRCYCDLLLGSKVCPGDMCAYPC